MAKFVSLLNRSDKPICFSSATRVQTVKPGTSGIAPFETEFTVSHECNRWGYDVLSQVRYTPQGKLLEIQNFTANTLSTVRNDNMLEFFGHQEVVRHLVLKSLSKLSH